MKGGTHRAVCFREGGQAVGEAMVAHVADCGGRNALGPSVKGSGAFRGQLRAGTSAYPRCSLETTDLEAASVRGAFTRRTPVIRSFHLEGPALGAFAEFPEDHAHRVNQDTPSG